MKICLRGNVIHERDGEEEGIPSAAQRKLLEAVLIKKRNLINKVLKMMILGQCKDVRGSVKLMKI